MRNRSNPSRFPALPKAPIVMEEEPRNHRDFPFLLKHNLKSAARIWGLDRGGTLRLKALQVICLNRVFINDDGR